MPDGLKLYPLNGGKLEIMQEIISATSEEELDEDGLGHCMFMLYASKFEDLREMDLEELSDAGREIALHATLEDRQAAEEVIVADFDALSASIALNPKPQARMKEEPSHSNGPNLSGRDFPLDTLETKSTKSPQSKLSKSALPISTHTEKRETLSNGQTQTRKTLKEADKSLSSLKAPTG